MRTLLAVAAFSAAAALPAAGRAAPTVACHCFQDRTWDPASPAAADQIAAERAYQAQARAREDLALRAQAEGAKALDITV